MIRETIYAALFAKLAASASFVTTSRRLKAWSDVSPIEQPALFLAQRSETATTVARQPTKWRLDVDVYLYVNTGGDPAVAPSTILNPILDAIVAAMGPDNGATNLATLGGLVQHAWIEGKIQPDEGVLGDQALAIVPISLLVA